MGCNSVTNQARWSSRPKWLLTRSLATVLQTMRQKYAWPASWDWEENMLKQASSLDLTHTLNIWMSQILVHQKLLELLNCCIFICGYQWWLLTLFWRIQSNLGKKFVQHNHGWGQVHKRQWAAGVRSSSSQKSHGGWTPLPESAAPIVLERAVGVGF